MKKEKHISWNVNGLRAVVKKGFLDFLEKEKFTSLSLQETKLQAEQIPEEIQEWVEQNGYHLYNYSAQKRGYSGVISISKEQATNVYQGFSDASDTEGRVLCLEFAKYYLLNCYFPNSQHGLLRLDYKIAFNQKILRWINRLQKKKPVMICGDFNVAHKPIDLKNPKTNEQNPGFCPEERESFGKILQKGWVDTFRHFYPDKVEEYSWWSYRVNARERNIGWRIDYFLINAGFVENLLSAGIQQQVMGSDHCPVYIEVST
ncbi:MAG: exodeoxyribonuclease III [Spirochaetota bacterium]